MGMRKRVIKVCARCHSWLGWPKNSSKLSDDEKLCPKGCDAGAVIVTVQVPLNTKLRPNE